MTINTIDGIRVMTADEGYWLAKDGTFTKVVYLGVTAMPSDWQEVSDSDYQVISAEDDYVSGTIIKMLDATPGTINYELPSPIGKAQLQVYIQKIDSSENPISITSFVASIFGGVTSLETQYAHVTYISDGANWYVRENN